MLGGAGARPAIDHAGARGVEPRLDQRRLDGLKLAAAAFTNLTPRPSRLSRRRRRPISRPSAGCSTSCCRPAAHGGAERRRAGVRGLAAAGRERGAAVIDYRPAAPRRCGCSRASADADGQRLAVELSGRRHDVDTAARRRVPGATTCWRRRPRARRPAPTASAVLPQLADARAARPAGMQLVGAPPSGAPVYRRLRPHARCAGDGARGAAAARARAGWSWCSAAAATATAASGR